MTVADTIPEPFDAAPEIGRAGTSNSEGEEQDGVQRTRDEHKSCKIVLHPDALAVERTAGFARTRRHQTIVPHGDSESRGSFSMSRSESEEGTMGTFDPSILGRVELDQRDARSS